MLIEAAHILCAGIVDDVQSIELAMSGGLAFQPDGGFFDIWAGESAENVLARIEKLSPRSPAFTLPPTFREKLDLLLS